MLIDGLNHNYHKHNLNPCVAKHPRSQLNFKVKIILNGIQFSMSWMREFFIKEDLKQLVYKLQNLVDRCCLPDSFNAVEVNTILELQSWLLNVHNLTSKMFVILIIHSLTWVAASVSRTRADSTCTWSRAGPCKASGHVGLLTSRHRDNLWPRSQCRQACSAS